MTFSDVLLWMAGVSWLMALAPAIHRARAGDRSALGYFALIAAVALPLCWAFPAARSAILADIWLVSAVVPGLLLWLAQRLILARRFSTALFACRLVDFCQPIGPRRADAALLRYQILLELGSMVAASRLASRFERWPESRRLMPRLLALRAAQGWPEILDTTRDLPLAMIGPWRLRAKAETGDLAGMLEDFQAVAAQFANQRINFQLVLTPVLAFGGRVDLIAGSLPVLAPEIRAFWLATATWAAGDEVRARDLLGRIDARGQPGLEAAVAWRLAHPPRPVSDLDAELRKRFASVADGAVPWLVSARPWCTWAIATACIAAFIAIELADDPHAARWYAGGFDTALGWTGNWWRFFAASFLHASPTHVAMNMFALVFIAPPLERALRWWRFLLLYLLAGAGGMALVLILYQMGYGGRVMVVGASASIMGLIAAELVGHFRNRAPGEPWWRHAQIRRLGLVLTLQVFFDLSHPQVSQAGHIGGFLTGLALAWALVPGPGRRKALGDGTPPDQATTKAGN